jgi:hypothetical protein
LSRARLAHSIDIDYTMSVAVFIKSTEADSRAGMRAHLV